MLTMKYFIHLVFSTYTMLLFARIALSWFPSLYQYKFARFLHFYTDPYLNVFKRAIPPIGGMLDLSPILGFFFLRLLESFLMKLV